MTLCWQLEGRGILTLTRVQAQELLHMTDRSKFHSIFKYYYGV